MIRLDRLQNPPQKPHLADMLRVAFPVPSAIDPKVYRTYKTQGEELSGLFLAQSALDFDYSSGRFLELFLGLSAQNRVISISRSMHYNALVAASTAQNLGVKIHWITPNNKSGIIELEDIACARKSGADTFILPLINADLLTQNNIIELGFSDNEMLILDASYTLALGAFPLATQFIKKSHTNSPSWIDSCDFTVYQSAFLINGETLGLPRGYGAMICNFEQTLHTPLMRENIFSALKIALLEARESSSEIDQKEQFFTLLKEKLGESLTLFAPIENNAPNTLALRFSNIRARALIQSLLLDKVIALNGQECLFGLSRPSSLLQSMGYDEEEARELLSISFEPLDDLENLTSLIALRYKQVNIYL
ncbi:MAG: hypothetical protein ACTTJS_04150 [Wolinella sp.]